MKRNKIETKKERRELKLKKRRRTIICLFTLLESCWGLGWRDESWGPVESWVERREMREIIGGIGLDVTVFDSILPLSNCRAWLNLDSI